MVAGDVLRLEMDFGDAAIIARRQPVEDFRQPLPRLPVDPAHNPEIDRRDRPVRSHEQIALMHVGVKIAVADRLFEKGQHQPFGQIGQIMALRDQLFGARDLGAVDPFDRHHPAIGAIPINLRNHIARRAAHRFRKFGRARRLAPQVEFAQRPALEIGDGQRRAQAAHFARPHRFQMRRRPFVGLDVAREAFADAGAKNLDRDGSPVGGDAAMDLRDRSRTDRIGFDRLEQRVERLAVSGLHRRLDLREGHGRQAVLQPEKVLRRILTHKIGPGRQRLAELDRCRTDRLEGTGVIGFSRLHGAEPRDPRQALDRRRRVGIALDPAQRPVPRQCAAPFQEPPDMRRRPGQDVRPSTRNGSRQDRP